MLRMWFVDAFWRQGIRLGEIYETRVLVFVSVVGC